MLVFLTVLLLTNALDAQAGSIKVEGVGFFNHSPLFLTKNAITEVCESFGDRVELSLYVEETEEGQKFMKEKNLTGHLPMALFINGSMTHKIGDRIVVFRDFIDKAWSKEDLRQVIESNLSGQKTAVPVPANVNSGFYNAEAVSTPEASSEEISVSKNIYYYAGGAVLLSVVLIAGWRVSRSKRR